MSLDNGCSDHTVNNQRTICSQNQGITTTQPEVNVRRTNKIDNLHQSVNRGVAGLPAEASAEVGSNPA